MSSLATKNHKQTLEPYTEIPLRERWVFENKEVLASIQEGIQQALRGEIVYLGSFEEYLEEDDDE